MKYEFIGLVEHIGSSGTQGHYIAMTLREGKYYRFNDESIEEINQE